MLKSARLAIIAIAFFVAAGAAHTTPVPASDPPSDLCTLLPVAQVSQTTGQTYGGPTKTVAPRPYANTVEGADCTYKKSKGSGELLFRAYADPSPAAAADLFARLGMFYSPQTPVAGLGDKAYFDPNHGLHVLKGRVRFFISMDDFGEKQAKALATYVVGEL